MKWYTVTQTAGTTIQMVYTCVESPVKPDMAIYTCIIGSLVKHFANYYKCRPEKLCFTLPHPAIHHTLNSYSGKRGWYKLRNVSRPTKISHTNSRNMITWHMQHYNQICLYFCVMHIFEGMSETVLRNANDANR